MKKFFKILSIALAFSFMIIVLSACNNITDAELSAVGKYNLTKITGLDDVTVDSYEYNHITLKDNNKFVMENKSEGTTFTSGGKWNLSGESLTLKLSGIFSKKETHSLADGVICFNGNINEKQVTLEFTKE